MSAARHRDVLSKAAPQDGAAVGQRYRDLFRAAPAPLWEEDFSRVKQALDALRAQGVRDFAAHFRAHPEFVRSCAGAVAVLDVNDAALRFHEAASKDELLAGLGRVFGEDSYDAFADELARIAAGERWFQFEAPMRTLRGARKEALLGWATAPGCEETLERVYVSAIDITERKRVTEALAEAYRIIDGSRLVAALVRAAPGWPIEFVSDNVERVYGYSKAELLGAKFRYEVVIHPDDRARVSAEIKQLSRGDTADTAVLEPYRVFAGDGTLRWVRHHLRVKRGDDGRVTHLQGVWEDITEYKQAEQKLARLGEYQRVVAAVNALLLRTHDQGALVARVCAALTDSGLVKLAWLGLAQDDGRLEPAACSAHDGLPPTLVATLGWRAEQEEGAPVAVALESRLRGENLTAWRDFAAVRGLGACAAASLRDDGRSLGMLVVCAEHADAFGAEELALLAELATNVTVGLRELRVARRLERTLESLRKSHDATIQAVATIGELRDPYTAGHQKRVAQLALAIGQELGYTEKRCEGLRVMGYVHDVGKIVVPAEILAKPGRLGRAEFELVKEHARAGYDILKGVEFPWPVAEAVLQHHERLDGSGYPLALSDGQILPEARVLAVADVVEAMANPRPYRERLGLERALREIRSKRGVQFDAAVVDACLRVFRERGFRFTD